MRLFLPCIIRTRHVELTGSEQNLGQIPYHAGTSLQMSEVYFHYEGHSTVLYLSDRGLFGYERTSLGTSFEFITV